MFGARSAAKPLGEVIRRAGGRAWRQVWTGVGRKPLNKLRSMMTNQHQHQSPLELKQKKYNSGLDSWTRCHTYGTQSKHINTY